MTYVVALLLFILAFYAVRTSIGAIVFLTIVGILAAIIKRNDISIKGSWHYSGGYYSGGYSSSDSDSYSDSSSSSDSDSYSDSYSDIKGTLYTSDKRILAFFYDGTVYDSYNKICGYYSNGSITKESGYSKILARYSAGELYPVSTSLYDQRTAYINGNAVCEAYSSSWIGDRIIAYYEGEADGALAAVYLLGLAT